MNMRCVRFHGGIHVRRPCDTAGLIVAIGGRA